MNKEEYLVSVIIPVYNADKNLKKSIESILNQTYANIELIVVNDGSTDGGYSEKIIQEYGEAICYYKKENGGIADALNYGIARANGKYIARMDQDDIARPERIEVQVKYMEQNSQIGVCGSYVDLVCGKQRHISEVPTCHDEILIEMLFRNPMHHPTIMFRQEIIKGKWLYDKESLVEDYELWSRMITSVCFANIDTSLLIYNVGETNYTSVRSKQVTKISTSIMRRMYQSVWGISTEGYSDESININELEAESSFNKRKNVIIEKYALLTSLLEVNQSRCLVEQRLLLEQINRQWQMLLSKCNLSEYIFSRLGVAKVYNIDVVSREEVLLAFTEIEKLMNAIPKSMTVSICGAGKRGYRLVNRIMDFSKVYSINIDMITDQEEKQLSVANKTYDVYSIDDLTRTDSDYYIVTAKSYYEEIKKELSEIGISENKIIDYEYMNILLDFAVI